MKNLKEKKYITVTDAGFIYLTDEGKNIAAMIYERHEFISKCLFHWVLMKRLQLKMHAG